MKKNMIVAVSIALTIYVIAGVVAWELCDTLTDPVRRDPSTKLSGVINIEGNGDGIVIENLIFLDPNECLHENGYLYRPRPITLERRVGATAELICDVYCIDCDQLLETAEEYSK